MMSSNDYIRLFRTRQIRYVELLRLSLTQRQCILDDDYPQLLTVLGMKQRLPLAPAASPPPRQRRTSRRSDSAFTAWSTRRRKRSGTSRGL